MSRWSRVKAATIIGHLLLAASVLAQAPEGRGAQPGPGRGAADAVPRPALLFKEEWRQPPANGPLTDESRRITAAAVGNPALELKTYGAQAQAIGVYSHEGRLDLWTGLARSPVAILLRDKANVLDLTGLARFRAMVRTSNLHVLHPALRLADGTLVAGNQTIDTNGNFLSVEVAFNTQRWYRLDTETLATMAEVRTVDLAAIEEVGVVDLMPSGGHGSAGYANLSVIELFAKARPRTPATPSGVR